MTFPLPVGQNLLSVRYIASNICIIPTQDPDLWGVFVGATGSREPIGIMTTVELINWLRQAWLDDNVKHKEATARMEVAQVEVQTSTADMADILAEIDLGF